LGHLMQTGPQIPSVCAGNKINNQNYIYMNTASLDRIQQKLNAAVREPTDQNILLQSIVSIV
jgi:hypothetical protein